MRAGTLRADANRAARVAADERASTGADRVQVDSRKADRQTADDALGDARSAASRQQTDVGGGPTHVDRDRVLEPGAPRDEPRADDAGRGARDEDRRRMRRRVVDRGHSARREHHERLRQAAGLRRVPERAQIPRCHRCEVRVGGRRRRALVLAELRRDLVRCNDMHPGMPRSQLPRHKLLVRRIAEREEQADRDRLRIAEVRQRREVERRELAVRAEPTAHTVATLERHEWLRLRLAQAVEVRARLPAQVQQVSEALGADKSGTSTAPL